MTSLIRRALTRLPAPALSLPAMGDRQSPLNVPIQRSEFHSRNHGENSARNRRTKVHQRVGRCDLARVPGARPLRHSAQFFGQGAARSAQKKRPRIAEVRNSQFLYFVLTNLMGLPVYEPCVTPGTRNGDIYQNKGLLEKYPHPPCNSALLTVLLGLSLLSTAHAQTITQLFAFPCVGTSVPTCPNGARPYALIQASDGNRHGAATVRQVPQGGTIFYLTTIGQFTLVFAFSPGTNKNYPQGGFPLFAGGRRRWISLWRGSERRLTPQEEVVAGSRTATTGGVPVSTWASRCRRDLLELPD